MLVYILIYVNISTLRELEQTLWFVVTVISISDQKNHSELHFLAGQVTQLSNISQKYLVNVHNSISHNKQ